MPKQHKAVVSYRQKLEETLMMRGWGLLTGTMPDGTLVQPAIDETDDEDAKPLFLDDFESEPETDEESED